MGGLVLGHKMRINVARAILFFKELMKKDDDLVKMMKPVKLGDIKCVLKKNVDLGEK